MFVPVYKLHNALLKVMARQDRKQSSLLSCVSAYTGMKLNIMKFQRYKEDTLSLNVRRTTYAPPIFGYI